MIRSEFDKQVARVVTAFVLIALVIAFFWSKAMHVLSPPNSAKSTTERTEPNDQSVEPGSSFVKSQEPAPGAITLDGAKQIYDRIDQTGSD
jgi:hypothetical protein